MCFVIPGEERKLGFGQFHPSAYHESHVQIDQYGGKICDVILVRKWFTFNIDYSLL